MSKKKVLVFEDEWATIRGSFELANIYAFNEELSFIVKTKSQDISFSSWEKEYGAVFVDITLAKNTKHDGFNIIKKILDEKLFCCSKIVILTGNGKIEEKLSEMGLDKKQFRILYKPIDFENIADVLKELLQEEKSNES